VSQILFIFSHTLQIYTTKNIAIIAFKEAASAAAALEHNGADFGGRWLNIKYSSDKPINTPRAPSQKEEGCVTVFVGNLSFNIDEDTMRETFGSCGEISSIRFATDRETGDFKGFGHVEFVDSDSTDKAVAMAGTYVMDRPLRVDYANDRRKSGGGFGGGKAFVCIVLFVDWFNSTATHLSLNVNSLFFFK